MTHGLGLISSRFSATGLPGPQNQEPSQCMCLEPTPAEPPQLPTQLALASQGGLLEFLVHSANSASQAPENRQAPKSGPVRSKPPPSAAPASRQSARTTPLQETGSGHILDGAMEKSHSSQKCHAQGGTHKSTWHACFSAPVELRQPQAE